MFCFRRNIKWLRKNMQLSQRQLAEIIGVTENTVYNWEREDASDVKYAPSMQAVMRIREVFDISIDDLLFTDMWNNEEDDNAAS